MAWIERIKIVGNQTVSRDGGYAKAEREFDIVFAPGELKTTDSASIGIYCRDMGDVVKAEIEKALEGQFNAPSDTKPAPAAASKPAPKATPDAPAPEAPKPVAGQQSLAGGPAPVVAPAPATGIPPDGLVDGMGQQWTKELKCKECGWVHEVRANKLKQPFVICDGSEAEKPHDRAFLKIDGSLGNSAGPKKEAPR